MVRRLLPWGILAVFIAHVLYAESSLGGREQFEVRQVLERAVGVAGIIKDRRDKAELLHRIALGQIRAREIAAAKKTLDQTLAVASSSKDRDWKDLMLFRVAAAQSMAGDVKQAMDTASKVSNEGRRQDALRSIVMEQARSGNVQEAIRIARSTDQGSALVSIAWIQAKSKDTKGALNTTTAIDNMYLRSQALVEIAIEQAKDGEISLATQTLSLIDEKLIPANPLCKAVRNLVRAGDVRSAKEIVSTFKFDPPDYGVADALVALSEAQIKLGDDKGALELVSKLPEEFKTDVLSRLAEAQVRVGNIQGAFETANQIKTEKHQVYVRTRIASAQAKAGHPEGALETVTGLTIDQEDRVAVLRDIAVSQIKLGDLAAAGKTLDELAADFGTETQMYALMVVGVAYAKAGKMSEAMNTIASIEGLMYRSAALRDIALAQAEVGDYVGAWKTAGTIQEKEAKGLALHGIAIFQAKAGSLAAAIERSSKQTVPFETAQVLLGVAEGILDRDGSENELVP